MNILAQIKSTVDTETLCEHYLGLTFKKKGKHGWGLCPIHDEKTASLCLFTDGKLKCFGCNWHGDGLDLLSAVLGKPLKTIIDMVAADYGLQRDELDTNKRQELRRKIEQDKKNKVLPEQFRQQVDTCFNKLSAMLRNTYSVRLKSEKDLDNSNFTAAFDLQAVLEWILDDLISADIERQFEALQRARRCGLWE